MPLDFQSSISKRKKNIGVFKNTHFSMAITLLCRIIMLLKEEYLRSKSFTKIAIQNFTKMC